MDFLKKIKIIGNIRKILSFIATMFIILTFIFKYPHKITIFFNFLIGLTKNQDFPWFLSFVFLIIIIILIFRNYSNKHQKNKDHEDLALGCSVPRRGYLNFGYIDYFNSKWKVIFPKREKIYLLTDRDQIDIDNICETFELEGPLCFDPDCLTELTINKKWKNFKYFCENCNSTNFKDKLDSYKLRNKVRRLSKSIIRNMFLKDPNRFEDLINDLYS